MRLQGLNTLCLAFLCMVCLSCQPLASGSTSLTPKTLAVVINENDADSVKAGEAYRALHGVPRGNLIRVKLPVKDTLSHVEYQRFQEALLRELPRQANGLALVWRKPFRVECMSITSAIAFGGDRAACAKGCKATKVNKWFFDPEGTRAPTRTQLRSMLVTGGDSVSTQELMQRGAKAQANQPDGKALLVVSGDKRRDVRQSSFAGLVNAPPGKVTIERRRGFVNSAANILFYFTGAVRVPHLQSIDFVPGAVADHLTSSGGNLYGNSQMSALEWIKAGATGSYGSVAEPCNFVSKFPDPEILIRRYVSGSSLLSAYWASVEMPGQGVFVGDPLARPFSSQ